MIKSRITIQDDDGNWRFPTEVLIHILTLVDDRWSVSMTCKKIYELTCVIEKNRRPLKIAVDKLDNDDLFNSIINSQRQFNDIRIDTCKLTTLQQFWRLKTILFKFGPGITNFSWESCKLTKSEIATLINFLPNVKSISAVSWKLEPELFDESPHPLEVLSLRKLKIAKCDKSTAIFFSNSLPHHILSTLEIQGELEDILANQKTITDLDLNVETLDHRLLANITLSNLKLKLRRYKNDEDQSIIQQTIELQPKITTLDLVNCEGCFDNDSPAFSAICKLTELKSLKINIDELSRDAFLEHFEKLKNLEVLEIESIEHNYAPVVTIVDDLSHLVMPRLESFKIYLSDIGLPLDRVERMGKNFAKLTNFTIRCDHPLPLDCYVENLTKLTSLHIDYHYSKEFAKICGNFNVKNENLKDLSLHGFGFGSDDVNWNEFALLKLTEIAPNLEKLEIDAAFPFNTELIFKIMEKWGKLRVIKNWSMKQFGDNYIKFDLQSVLDLRGISGMLDEFSIELRLRAVDTDVSRVKEDLSKEFNVAVTRVGNFIVIRMKKK